MRIALISDLHANLQATMAVLTELDRRKPDYVLCLGDLIGYGPNPNEVVGLIRERGYDTVLGNHDAVLTGKLSLGFFREPNQSLLKRSMEMLSEENRTWLSSRPLLLEGEDWIAAHASPVKPEEWIYLDSSVKCHQVLHLTDKKFVFVGHTHRPGLIGNEFGLFGLKPGYRYVVNPGSVGQPRDGDDRASFCILDPESLHYENVRVHYEVEDTLKAHYKLGIKPEQARRLLALI